MPVCSSRRRTPHPNLPSLVERRSLFSLQAEGVGRSRARANERSKAAAHIHARAGSVRKLQQTGRRVSLMRCADSVVGFLMLPRALFVLLSLFCSFLIISISLFVVVVTTTGIFSACPLDLAAEIAPPRSSPCRQPPNALYTIRRSAASCQEACPPLRGRRFSALRTARSAHCVKKKRI